MKRKHIIQFAAAFSAVSALAFAAPALAQSYPSKPIRMSTILMGVLILGEPFTAWVAAGTVLVIAGIFVFTRGR